MIEFTGASIQELFLQKIKEDGTEPSLVLSEFSPSDEETLKNIFLRPFQSLTTTYQFHHEVDIDLNVLYQLSKKMQEDRHINEAYEDIMRHLKASSRHPNIKDGDVFIIRFSELSLGSEIIDGLGIFKVEKKDTYLETPNWTKEPTLLFKEGIGEKKLDKACLILFTASPYTVLAYDNNSNEAVYWKNDFIQLDFKQDHINNTNHFLQMTKSYITDQLPEEFDL